MNRTALIVTAAAFALGIVADVLTDAPYVPGYSATIGLAGCMVLIVATKWLGAVLIKRDEDFYPEDTPADSQEDLRG